MNKDTRTCYPSMDKIKEKTNLSVRFINDSIHRLENFGLIQVTRRKGTSNLYYFPPETDQFEMFSEEFLDMELPARVKEYYMKIQKTLYDKDQQIATTHYNDSELARITGVSKPTVRKYNLILEQSGYMTSKLTNYKDESGFTIRELSFDMQKLGQFGLWVKAITEQVVSNTDDIQELRTNYNELQKEVKELRRRLDIKEGKTDNVSFEF